MYVYIWKTPEGSPFYVGFTKNRRRTNPRNEGNRNWLCRQKMLEVGVDRIVVELRPVASIEEGTRVETQLIELYGRIQMGTGTLTNLMPGGQGAHPRSAEHIEKLRQALLDPNHPIRGEAARAKQAKRMKDADIREKFAGDANPAKREEVRAKIKAKWADPEYRTMMLAKKLGRPLHSDEEKQRRRERLLDPSNPMREYHKVLNSDPTIAAKRAATLRSPEQRRRQSEAMKAYWAKRKAEQ